jgi:hypothetical protein
MFSSFVSVPAHDVEWQHVEDGVARGVQTLPEILPDLQANIVGYSHPGRLHKGKCVFRNQSLTPSPNTLFKKNLPFIERGRT